MEPVYKTPTLLGPPAEPQGEPSGAGECWACRGLGRFDGYGKASSDPYDRPCTECQGTGCADRLARACRETWEAAAQVVHEYIERNCLIGGPEEAYVGGALAAVEDGLRARAKGDAP